MTIRPFDWRDLPILLRYRHHALFFDNALVLTRGQTWIPAGAILSYFAPATGVFTYLLSHDRDSDLPLMGQVIHTAGSQIARLSFLAPEAAIESQALPQLIDHMITQIGWRGAFHLLAEVDERTVAFEMLRQASFAIYVRQRVWQLSGESVAESNSTLWRASTDNDLIAVRSLYNNLVPGLVQQVEPPPADHLHSMVYCKGDDLLAYVELRYGLRGIWVHPFIHPDAEDVIIQLVDRMRNLRNRRSRPIYLCVRSYQSWLENALEELDAAAGPLQAVMVKHLAIAKRVGRTFALPALEGGQPEVTAPFARSESKK